jgi:hypothetical protein
MRTKTNNSAVTFNTDDVFAASCAAHRINNGYFKFVTKENNITETNRQIINRYLNDISLITNEDREQAEAVINYYKGFTFRILQGKNLSHFNNSAMLIANKEVISNNYDISLIASLPSSYERGVEQDRNNNKLDFARGGLIGKVGDKLELEIEVLRSVFSHNYCIFFITGLTSDDQVVFFSYKKGVELGENIKIKGTVKAHKDNSTQLNRVKIL